MKTKDDTMKIPTKFRVGGQDIVVKMVELCEDSDCGNTLLAQGEIQIAEKISRGVDQSASSKYNTFWHELTHSILITMGEYELNKNETFVCSFSGFLTEAIRSLEYEEEN